MIIQQKESKYRVKYKNQWSPIMNFQSFKKIDLLNVERYESIVYHTYIRVMTPVKKRCQRCKKMFAPYYLCKNRQRFCGSAIKKEGCSWKNQQMLNNKNHYIKKTK